MTPNGMLLDASVSSKKQKGEIRIQQALIVIDHLHISDFDSKIMRFSGVISL